MEPLLLLLLWLGLLGVSNCAGTTPLDDYVNRPDPNFSYKAIKKYDNPGYTSYVLNMTSQQWKTSTVVSRPIWWHYLTVHIPDVITNHSTSLLFIDGGSNHDDPPDMTNEFVALTGLLSLETKSVTAVIDQIPNQPINFTNDPDQKDRSEDALIAWTWKMFIDNPADPDILLQLPMTKAVVRGMDAVTNFTYGINTSFKINRFIVAGASKRAWATWTTGAVDKRVIGIAPIVLDCLNFAKNLHHHYRAYGGWSFALQDYYAANITLHLDDPKLQLLMNIIDPLAYADRLTMPKYIISATGDEFFLLDDSHYYYTMLSQPKYLRVVPNAEHSMLGHLTELFFGLKSFYLSVTQNYPLPQFSWKREQTMSGGRITLFTKTKPTSVKAFFARTIQGTRRDFRLLIGTPGDPTTPYPQPIIWFQDDVHIQDINTYVAEYDRPTTGWLAFLIQVTYAGPSNSSLELSTEVCVVPDIFPYEDCQGASCYGTLL